MRSPHADEASSDIGMIQKILDAQASLDVRIGEVRRLLFASALLTRDLPLSRQGNHLFDVRSPGSISAAEAVLEVNALYRDRGLSCFNWVLGAGDVAAEFKAYLSGLGWRRRCDRFYRLKAPLPAPTHPGAELLPLKADPDLTTQVLREIFAAEGNTDAGEQLQVLRATDRVLASQQVGGFIACDRRRPVGMIRYVLRDAMCYVSDLDVFPEFRRRGVGRMLLQRVIQDADHAAVTLYTDSTNSPAITLYERAGFEFLGTSETYYGPPSAPR